MTYHINIVSKTNGVGLDQDIMLITQTLESKGFKVSFSPHKGLGSLWRCFQRTHKADANIFIERVFPSWIGRAKNNILVPNQERFPRRLLSDLKYIDAVFCKTHHALDIFKPLHQKVHYIGFTSADRFDLHTDKDYGKFFHLAGKSNVKGTEDILALWKQHPEWPILVLVQHPNNAPKSVPGNVCLYAQAVNNSDLQRLQNKIGIHLCPSRTEGWGHYIVEAMSTQAVVVTTNGAPMNELVNSSRGRLVTAKRLTPRHLGTSYFVDIAALEKEIKDLITSPLEDKQILGEQARQWFLSNQEGFPERLTRVLNTVLER